MNLQKMLKFVAVLSLVVAVGACKSKKKVEDTENGNDSAAVTSAPQIENTPMNFDAGGSDGEKIAGLETIHFDHDKSAIGTEARKTLENNVGWMKSHNNVNIQIEGHCDAAGSIEYNLALGERRAKAVKEYMVGLGIADNRLSIISYGKEKPLATGDSEAVYLKNRRANFLPLVQ